MHHAQNLSEIMVHTTILLDMITWAIILQKTGAGVVLCGDARFDSPGFSAKFMTYFIQVWNIGRIF